MRVEKGKIEMFENLYLNFLTYVGVGLGMLLIGLFLFVITTREKEFKLIGENNQTAAMVLGGKFVGLAFVIGSAMTHSVSIMDMVIWGFVGIASQIIAFFLAELLTIKFSITQAILDDNKSVGTFLLLMSIGIGWVVAAALTY